MSDTSWTRKLRRYVASSSSLELGVVGGLIVPLALMHVGLRIVRLIDRGTGGGVLTLLDLFKGDVLLVAGLGLFAVGLVRRAGAGAGRRLAVVGLQVVFLLVAAMELIGHNFYMATGSILDYSLIAHSIAKFELASAVMVSEIPVGFVVMSAVAALGVVALPWGVAWWSRRAFEGSGAGGFGEEAGEDGVGSTVLLMAAGGLLALGAGLPALVVDNTSFARPAAANILLSISPGGSSGAPTAGYPPADYEATGATIEPTGGAGDGEKRNLVFINLESTRARSTTPYNPDRETTPNLEELADESVLAEDAYAVVPHTSKALIAMHCGIEPRLNMPVTESRPDGIPAECVADLLKQQDYRTVFFQSARRAFDGKPVEGRAQMVENFGFEEFYSVEDMDTTGMEKANYFGYEDDVMLDPSREWLEEHGDEPFYVSYLTLTPHHQYLAPRRYGRHDFADGERLNRYLNAVHYVDQFVQNILDQYRDLGLYEETIFVIVGDHGEGFGEHGRNQHDNVIWQEGLRVPFVIHDPQRADAPERIDEPVNHLDMLPTSMDLLGYEIEGANYPGKSIFEVERTRPMYAHCWYERRCMARIEGDEKFIHHFDKRGEEFYDLGEDPREKTNIIAEQADSKIDALRRDLKRWRGSVIEMYRDYSRDDIEEFVYRERPEIDHELEITYGDKAKFLGYDLSREEVRPGQTLKVTYYFETLKKIGTEWKLFVHGEGGGKMLHLDHVPNKGLYPLNNWKPGEYVADVHEFQVPEDFSGESLRVYLGIYSHDEGRLPIEGDVQTKGERRPKILEIPVVRD